MASQHPFTFIAEIHPDKVEQLRFQLKTIQSDLYNNPIINFRKISTLHFARLLIIDAQLENNHIKYPPYLVISTNFDGDLDLHLQELLESMAYQEIFQHCKSSPSLSEGIDEYMEFLKKHSDYKAYFYRGTWGRSVQQILSEETARKATEDFLDSTPALYSYSQSQIKHMIAKNLVDLDLMKKHDPIDRPSKDSWWQIGLMCLSILVLMPLILGLFIPLLLIYLIILRRHELKDAIQEEKYSNLESTTELKAQEDKIIQNQLTHLVDIKPGKFRLFTLKMILGGIYFLARNYFNKGRLGNISTIHFARWVIIDNGKRLLFFSNYDGSWESYLSDFVDRAAVGLTGVWSNTMGFPKSKFLLWEGARDEQRFKAWTRRNQLYTDVWYSAYKDLTVKNINNNTEINEGLFKKMNEEELDQFLRKY